MVNKMKEKNELLKECAMTLQTPKVSDWYHKNLRGKPQADTINLLEVAVSKGDLTVREALSVVLVVGIQWNLKFEGVP